MAATNRAASPNTSPHTEPFPALETDPRTPVSLTSPAHILPTANNTDTTNLLRPHLHKADLAGGDVSPKSGRLATSPVTLTGVAAEAELRKRKLQQERSVEVERETTPNPALQAMQSLMGGGGISKPSDAPAPDKLSEPMQKVAEKMIIDNPAGESMQASPVSLSSFGTIETTGSAAALTATAHDDPPPAQHFVAEPAQMTAEPGSYPNGNGLLGVAEDQEGHKAFSYPGPPPSQQEQNKEGGPSRGMSLPGYGQGSPKSPASNKRHKCPYCSTDFTRHHNLKSHLLTHSQEKPYVCQTCQARFRRLHDLKRHTKLHTGERPHTCDKCGRRFARGDALARHNKGPGGCAGRRSSFGGEDDFGDEGMDGVEYDGDDGSSPDHGRRVSEPSRKRAHLETPQDPSRAVYRQQSNTYPPPQHARPHSGSMGNMAPPQVVLPGANSVSSPRDMSGQPSPGLGSSMSSSYYGSGQVLPQQSGMIESPKPLSPGQPMQQQDQHRLSVGDASHSSNRNRSPSLTQQFQQTHFGRGSGGRTPPQAPSQFASASHGGPPVPMLPPLGSQPQSRPPFQSTSAPGGPGPSSLHHQQVPPMTAQGGGQGSNQGSLSSHGRSSGGSMRDVVGQDGTDIWTYVRNLEQRFSRMQDEYELRISRLQEEVISLKGQMSNAASYSSEMQPRY